MDKRDRDALKRSMELCRAEEGRTRQLNAMLKDDGWWHAATFASMHCQCQALNLYPWQSRRALRMAITATRLQRSCCNRCSISESAAMHPTRWRQSSRRSGRR